MDRIQEIEKALERVKSPSQSYVFALEKNQEWNIKSKEYVEYLLAENKRYKEALTFYANELNYSYEWDSGKVDEYSKIDLDEGKKARETLKEE